MCAPDQADGKRAAAGRFNSGPACQGEYNTHKFSQPGADNPGGIENGIKQLADGKTSGGPERRAFYGGD